MKHDPWTKTEYYRLKRRAEREDLTLSLIFLLIVIALVAACGVLSYRAAVEQLDRIEQERVALERIKAPKLNPPMDHIAWNLEVPERVLPVLPKRKP